MDQFGELDRQIDQLMERETASLAELRNLLLEIEEFINSEHYQSLSIEERNRLQTARKEVVGRIQQDENGESAAAQPAAAMIRSAMLSVSRWMAANCT